MTERTPDQLKGQINSFAKKMNLQPQEVLQMFFMERILARLSQSEYATKFILKGGLLISSLLGVTERTTMDIDTTVTGLNMSESTIENAIRDVLSININDGITFQFERLSTIREDDDYNNYRAHFTALFGKIKNKMKIDITTGDVITPAAINYSYKCILDEDEIKILAYNTETILAEKYETIIRRNIGSTRARDFYDLYVLTKLNYNSINHETLRQAIIATATKRNSLSQFNDWQEICNDIKNDNGIIELWKNYQSTHSYAKDISFSEIIDCIENISSILWN